MKSYANALVATAVAAALTQAAASGSAQPTALDSVEITAIGVLTCEIRQDIRLLARSARGVRCNFTPRGAPPGTLFKYRGSLRDFDETDPSTGGDMMSWTVIAPQRAADADIRGAYSRACDSFVAERGLRPRSLVGGRDRNVVLEPRVEDLADPDRNAAAAVVIFELTR